MASSSQQHAVNIEKLSASTKQKLGMLPPLSSERCIYKVPDRMRVSNEQLFTPQVVSIGPIHYQNGRLRANEHLKERYLAEFLELSRVSLEEYFQHISNNETRLRNCYAHFIELDSENFVKMVLVDAAFLLMILLCFLKLQIVINDPIFGRLNTFSDIMNDMMLLENQLPFFILEDLYKLSKLHILLKGKFSLDFDEEISVTRLAREFLRKLVTPSGPEKQHPSYKAEHILDLYRSCLIPTDWEPERETSATINMPSTKELYQAGVKIQIGSEINIFDIRFRDGILKIPPLTILGPTKLLFINVAAFEQCHYPAADNIFCNYIEMMKTLSLSSSDVELLIQNEVIINGLGTHELVSTLFMNIAAVTLIDVFLYSDVMKGLNEYYNNCWHRWKATLKQKYFKAPWAICSVSLAVFLLVLTIVQTVFTILQVVIPDHK